MYDLSLYMKTLKQRYSQWYNRHASRRGTLWEERYKSVGVEGTDHALMTMAADIDLNAVFAAHRDCFGPRRKEGARALRFGEWGGLCGARDLRKSPIMASPGVGG